MTSYDYLIIGGSQVADDAARALREHDTDGTIGIVSSDEDAPYTRPAHTEEPDVGRSLSRTGSPGAGARCRAASAGTDQGSAPPER